MKSSTPKITILFFIIITLFHPSVFGGLEQERQRMGGSLKAKNHELPYIPRYCWCKVAESGAYNKEYNKWTSYFEQYGKVGEGWGHIHHYCSGLLMLNRYQRRTGDPKYLLGVAEKQFNYMITHSSKNFILMPEIYKNMGLTQKLMGNKDQAIQYLLTSIKLKRDYEPAYLELITILKSTNPQLALQIVEQGLKYSPDSEALKQMAQTLKK